MLAVNVGNLFSVMVLSVIITKFTVATGLRGAVVVGNLSAKSSVSFNLRKYTINRVLMDNIRN